ncbi:MAG: sulfotransferase [Chloroflexi bacterium]|nr:sulfotransferase [Chloroflexota bacterium]
MTFMQESQPELENIKFLEATIIPAQQRFVFIVGVSRSGTTLLRKTLNRSDQIAISNENHFLGHLYAREGARFKFRRFGDLNDDENVRRLVAFIYDGGLEASSRLRGMSKHWHWIVKMVDRNEFLNRVLASDRSEAGLFTVMMQVYADRKRKPIMGEKTPSHVRYVPTLFDWFPGAKVIHMLRDPRAIFVSELRRRRLEPETWPYKQLRHVGPLFALYILLETSFAWLESVSLSAKYRQQYPDKYYRLRFEDLVAGPEPHLRRVCAFLEVEFQDKMLKQKVVSKGFAAGQVGFDAEAAGRWQSQIHPWANAWFSFWFQKQLKELGFPCKSRI